MPADPNETDLKLRSEEIQEILSKPPSWIIRWGITLIFIFTLIILTLSIIIRYPDFITTRIIVTTEIPTERIIARYSGALEKLYVSNGDSVKVGQRLAVLRNTANIEAVYKLKYILDTVQDVTETFSFPITEISHSLLGEIGTAYINFEKSYVDYHLLKDLDPYANLLSENRVSLSELRRRLKDQIVQRNLLEEELELEKTDFERHNVLYRKGVISQQEFESKKGELLQMEKSISSMAISISQMREAIASSSYALSNTRINQQEEDTRLFSSLNQNYYALQKALLDWEYNYVLSSSLDGTISFQGFWGENQYISTGETVFTVLPNETGSLVGKLSLPSQNAGKVAIGQKVLVKLDNFPYQQFGMLIGRVKNISVSPGKEGSYFVYIHLPNGTLTSYNNELPFDQELLGSAEIITEDLSVAERFFYKLKDVFQY